MIEALIRLVKGKLRVYSNYVVIFAAALLIVSLVRNITKTLDAQDRIKNKEEKVAELQAKNENLQKELTQVTSEDYIEGQIRDKLGLVKEGEVIIVLPEDEVLKRLAPETQVVKEVLPLPNWEKWLKLFGF